MIVVDTNVIAYRFIAGDKTKPALRLEKYDADWRVPYLWRYEYLNVLSTLTKNSIIKENQGIIIWQNTLGYLNGREYGVDAEKVLRISIHSGISAYDACYIILAQSLNTKCATSDNKLVRLFPERTLFLDDF